LAGPFDGVIDNVGGGMLADVYALLGPDALMLSVGMASLVTTRMQRAISSPLSRAWMELDAEDRVSAKDCPCSRSDDGA
jgi:NADPH:quinone reductase-like Zn-dependent oxidoreductase